MLHLLQYLLSPWREGLEKVMTRQYWTNTWKLYSSIFKLSSSRHQFLTYCTALRRAGLGIKLLRTLNVCLSLNTDADSKQALMTNMPAKLFRSRNACKG